MKKRYIDFNPFFLKIINLNSRIEFVFSNFNDLLLSNSLSYEDIFLLNFINIKKKKINIFFLNTGRLFNNFFNFLNKLKNKYFLNLIEVYNPNSFLSYKYIKKYGLNSFYKNTILRKICCYIRKIELYNKILYKKEIILTGQRRSRITKLKNVEFDYQRNIIKYNLIFKWDYKDIFYFIEKFNIMVNYAYNYGFSSIGCMPCTKKVFLKNTARSGRWWWESFNDKKECGLHL